SVARPSAPLPAGALIARPSPSARTSRGNLQAPRPPPEGVARRPVASRPVNQMKTRLQSLGLLDRALRAMTEEELDAVVGSLDDDHREAVERLAGGTADAASIRAAAAKGRMDGTLESLAMVLTD